MTNKLIDQFSALLDQLLGIESGQVSSNVDHPKTEFVLEAASVMHAMDFGGESAPRLELRARWERKFQPQNPNQRPLRKLVTIRAIWMGALILALALIVAFRQPVLAAVSRLFGYIYVQDSGFLPANSTFVIQQPVMQEHDGSILTVTRGVSTPDGITLYLETSATASPADGALLETDGGTQLVLSYWEYFPNTPGSHGVRLIFPALPAGLTRTTLVLPTGWHLPLEWIPAAQSQLLDVRAVPYVDVTQQPTPAAGLCVEKHGINLCLQAATTGAENTSVLLDAQPTNPALIPSSFPSLVWQSETEPVTLRDEQGNIYPLDNQRPMVGGTLTFPPIAGTHTLTLTIPALFANVDIPDQIITVDVGNDPQPDTVIPLDVNIQVLDTTVHFSKATFVGDGVSSLRLTLNADEPIQTVDDITPDQLELGRPDRVDDLYGGGNFAGSKDIFVELIRGSGKITGVLNLPVISATVIVHGPFEFTFTLSDTAVITPTPLVANPGNFSPAPTPTPMSLERYFYSGQTLQAGDLLYSAWNGTDSDIYRYSPADVSAPALFMTLPRQVFNIYIHADREGLDYLAGDYDPDSNMVNNTGLYTLRFSDPRPRLLHTSPEGILTQPTWSSDGRLLAFDFQLPDPGELWPRVGWIDMNCRSSGECPVQVLDAPAEYRLGASAFSPQGYWLALNGVDTTYGAGEIYLLQFDNNGQPSQVQNITNTGQVSDGGPQWISGNRLVWDCTDPNASDPNKDVPNICLQDISSGSSVPQKIFTYNDIVFYFGLSSQGNYFWQNVFVRIDPGSYQMWLHDRNGGSRLLTASPWFDQDYGKPAFSLDERYLAYFSESYYDKSVPETLHIAETATGKELATFGNLSPIGWLGWVP
jgi:hypothetical protein